MTDDWIKQQRQAAGVTADKDLTTALQAIEGWKEKAREEAQRHARHATKEAVQNCPPADGAARALFDIFATHAERIFHICRQAHEVYTTSSHSDEPALDLDDLLQEAYPLFLRSMIRHTDRGVGDHLQRAFRDRVRDYVETTLTERDDPDDRPALKDESRVAPGFDIPRLYQELRESDRLSRRAERAYDRLHPERE
ncbi:hypothetical protein GGP85_002896 [Salinibacter ruber]|uniref:hypothetical protein n=1 Tax=Salinibacter ruber TaxID=146919 RepID=UPI00216735AD|nr:hypothetical protein [Salinibacter ruber]MCS3827426.1 hypothetical protein [Salinibacter ruber]